MMSVNERLREAEEKVETLQSETQALEESLKEASTGTAEEAMIRENLNMARQNEVVVLIPEELITRTDESWEEDRSEEEKLSNWQQWLRIIWNKN